MAPSQPHTALCVRHGQGRECLSPAPELCILNLSIICSGSVCILLAPHRRQQHPLGPLALPTAALPLAETLACPMHADIRTPSALQQPRLTELQ